MTGSREANLLRGITQNDLKKVIRKALEEGWVLDEMTGTTHTAVKWKNGERVTFGTTSSDRNAHKVVLRKIEAIMGRDLFPKHKTGRSRKNVKMAGYIDTFSPETQREWSARVEQLINEHRELVLEFKILATAPVTRTDINRAAEVIRRLSQIEDFLTELKQPIEKFVPK